jgi:hypothetical protein
MQNLRSHRSRGPLAPLSAALALLLVALSGAPAFAQTTGQIQGVVTDQTGAVVPNAAVTASGERLISPQSVTADDQGRFRFFNLPPGNYTVRVEAGGFQPREMTNVSVTLDRTTTLEPQLSVAVAGEKVDVTTSDSAPIDTTTTEVSTEVNAELLARLPTTRTLQSVFSIAPSVTGSGLVDANGRETAPAVMGSSGPENNYILDGVSTTDPAYGTQGANIAFDFIQEVQVKTAAFSAEYGQSTGGIINAITKSGGDEFHGDVFYYFTPSAFVADAKDSAIPVLAAIPNGFSESDFGFDIGGPVLKEKLWFFAAFNPQWRTNHYLGESFHLPMRQEIFTPFYALKLTWQASQDHRLTASTFGDHNTLEGTDVFNAGLTATGFSSDPSYADVRQRSGGPKYSFRYDGSFGDRFVVNATLGLHYQRLNVDPLDPARGNLPFTYEAQAVDPLTGQFRTGLVLPNSGPGNLTSQRRTRFETGFDLTYLLSTEHAGEHTLKGGYEYQDNHYDVYAYRSGGGYLYNRYNNLNPSDINNPVLEFRDSRYDVYQLDADTHTKIHSFYVLDQWRPFRHLSLNLGLRWEMPRLEPDAAAKQIILADPNFGREYYFKFTKLWENAAPRVGFSYDFTHEGRGKIYGNYARYFESAIPLDLNARAASGETYILNFFSGPLGTGDLNLQFPLAGAPTAVDPGLKAPYLEELTGGVEYELFRNFAVGGRFVWRDLARVIEDGSFDQGNSYFIMNPGESVSGLVPFRGKFRYFAGLGLDDLRTVEDGTIFFPKAVRKYRAVELTAEKRFSDNYTFLASYTWSRLRGNFEGLFRNDNGQLDPNITSLFDLPELLFNTYGPLPNERPHQFKFDGAYQFGFGLNTGVSFRAMSGTPVSYLGPHNIYGNGEAFLEPRGSAGRTPVITTLDVHLAYGHDFTDRFRGQLIFDVFNVLDQQKAITVDQRYRLDVGKLSLSPVNPLFGLGTSYQYPLTARVGLKFQF